MMKESNGSARLAPPEPDTRRMVRVPSNATRYRKPQATESLVVTIVAATPQIEYTGATVMHFRTVRARLHEIAAAVELTSASTRERWVVRIEHDSDYHGRVVLELASETDADLEHEAERGFDLLRGLVARAAPIEPVEPTITSADIVRDLEAAGFVYASSIATWIHSDGRKLTVAQIDAMVGGGAS